MTEKIHELDKPSQDDVLFQVMVYMDSETKSIIDTALSKREIIKQLDPKANDFAEFTYKNDRGVDIVQRIKNERVITYLIMPPSTVRVQRAAQSPGHVSIDPRVANAARKHGH